MIKINEGFIKAELDDYSQYKEGQSRTGGSYEFYETMRKNEETGLFYITYGTSAEIGNYCRVCGRFSGGTWSTCCSDEDIIEFSQEEAEAILAKWEKLGNKEDYTFNIEQA